jgi:hypothetical protein
MSAPLPHAASARFPGGLSAAGFFSLVAVLAVLVVVSVPRLRGLAVRENEADARQTAELLVAALRRMELEPGEVPAMREVTRRPELARVLSDADLLAEGRLLRRHGYLFEVTCVNPPLSLAAPAALLTGSGAELLQAIAVRAWPWAHGATGETAFLVTAGGARLRHANADAQWEGTSAAGTRLHDLSGWRGF